MISKDSAIPKGGAEILPLEMGYLPEFFQKRGEVEINYTQEIRERTLQELKALMADDNRLKRVEVQDELLLMFLASRKHDVRRTFKTVKSAFHFRRKNMEMFTDIKFEALSPLLTVFTPLPWRCQDGHAIILIDLENFCVEKQPVEAIKQMLLVVFLMGLREPMTLVNGYKVIFNLNATNDVLKLLNLHNIYLFYYGMKVVLPARVKELHAVNMGLTGRTMYNMIRIFFSEKIKNRIHVHTTADSLFKFFPKTIIPSKYGGELKDYDMTSWLRKNTSSTELSILEMRDDLKNIS